MTALDWTPPAGMETLVARSWRTFYSAILRDYGTTPVDYRVLYIAQKGRCWICRTAKGIHPDDPKGRGGRRLGVDHNHAKGNRREAVRGLLCTGGDRTCNRIIGWLGPEALSRASRYLLDPPAPWALAVLDAQSSLPGPAPTVDELADEAQRVLWERQPTVRRALTEFSPGMLA